jgi:beta-lactamase regulating signal transducer with metallopeptidase domain
MLLLWWFSETTLVAGLIGVIASAVGRFQRFGPALRQGFWLVALARLMMPPVLAWPAIPAEWRRPPAESTVTGTTIAPSTRLGAVEDDPAELPFETAPAEVVELEPPPGLSDSLGLATLATGSPPASPALARQKLTPCIPWVLSVWALGSIAFGGVQVARILVFSRRIRASLKPPVWLAELLDDVAAELGVRAPRLVVSDSCGSPLLWCFGRARLVVPARLVKVLSAERWRVILAHELAHLRRGDPWAGRLALAAGLIWWWNPLYWWIKRQMEHEAELACDAWVISLLPEQRRCYAETLIDICESFSNPGAAAPALGVAGRPGAFLERRLTMILKERVSYRVPAGGFLTLVCLALLAAPSWTKAYAQDDPTADAAKAVEQARKAEDEAIAAKLAALKQSRIQSERDQKRAEPSEAKEALEKRFQEQRTRAEKQLKEAMLRLREAQARMEQEVATRSKDVEKLRAALEHMAVEQREVAARVLADANLRHKLEADAAASQGAKDTDAAVRETRAKIESLQKALEAVRKREADQQATSLQALAKMREEMNVRARSLGDSGSLERRVANLEAKFDAVLNELRALRGELKSSGEANKK